ncbi:DUF1015 domain-containing protein [Elizabethkingia sp. JS20170427COW]|uniref:DUF1015 domain-containing protein n=1 Tax=Elizabethkingia sp. JS20170427COW TaxID=2583851 RepID=UPI0011104C40|nr:DUF1015 domain-containing protein [Elizabethkingia sp. JS20170427COW]QCX52257.1 DUF1015 domain-containing protein [Elizabethkingia sp. JS20170427COW]
MPLFKPFKGIRPKDSIVENFISTSIDNLTDEVLSEKVNKEDTFLNMIKPFICSKSKDVDRTLRKVRTNFETLCEENKLKQDASSIYLYSQTLPDKTVYRGLLGLTAVEDFFNGKIKKHESTLHLRKEKFAHYLDKVKVQSEPVLLTYHSNSKIELMMNLEEKTVPIYNFTTEDGVKHKVWQIENRLKLKQFKDVFDQIDSFYIADGHHRIGSIGLNAKNHLSKNKKTTGHEGYNFIFSYLVSNQSIQIHDYNRVIKDLNQLSEEEFLKALEEFFIVHEKGDETYLPSQKYHISMYLNGKFYSLHIKHDLRTKVPGLEDLDHYFLEKNVINNILGIASSKNSDRIDFLKGNSTKDGIENLKKLIDDKVYQVGFAMYPVPYTDLVKVSDLDQKMPPKCTNIEPKLLTALVLYDMK